MSGAENGGSSHLGAKRLSGWGTSIDGAPGQSWTGYWYLRPSKSLSFKTAATIAWRELRASKAKFSFVILSVAIGVAALTGVRGFSESFPKTMLEQARRIMAGDLSARMFRQPTAQEAKQLDALSTDDWACGGRGDGDGLDGGDEGIRCRCW